MRIKISERLWNDLFRGLFARKDVETAGIILAEPQTTTAGRILIVQRAFVLPDEAYAIRRADRLRIDPVWLNRLVRPARDAGWSIITIHTHPGAARPWFSAADDDGDARLMPAFAVQAPNAPHGSIVAVDSGTVAARLVSSNELAPAGLFVVGRTLTCVSLSGLSSADEPWFARQALALGAAGQALLRQLRVGVVGLGGTGSVVGVQLAHLGVGEIVAIDGDMIDASNISRVVGATVHDIDTTYKVDVFDRYTKSLGLPVRVTPVRTPLDGTIDSALLRSCDVILSCVDRHAPRAILNRLAYGSLVPVIDLGTAFRVDMTGQMIGDAGRVVVVGPGRPCLACWGHIDPDAIRRETLSAEARNELAKSGYIDGTDAPQPSVIAFNTMVAGAAVVELLRLVTRFAGADDPPDRLAFSFSAGGVRRNRMPAHAGCKICALKANSITQAR